MVLKFLWIPAQRRSDVIVGLQDDLIKIDVLESKWFPVQVTFDSDGVYFSVNNGELRFYSHNFGFDYLVNQFRPDYQAALNRFHGD